MIFFIFIMLIGCMNRSKVHWSRAVGVSEEEKGTPQYQITTSQARKKILVRVEKKTPFHTYSIHRKYSGYRFKKQDSSIRVMNGYAAVLLLVGGVIQYGQEEEQIVERITVKSDEGPGYPGYPQLSKKSVEAKSRMLSTSLFIMSGVSAIIALVYEVGPVLPAHNRSYVSKRQLLKTRWTKEVAPNATVEFWIDGTMIGKGQTDEEGQLVLSSSALSLQSVDFNGSAQWKWQLTAKSHQVQAKVDLRSFHYVGKLIAQKSVLLLRRGEISKSRHLISRLHKDDAAAFAWSSWCNAAQKKVVKTKTPNQIKVLLPPSQHLSRKSCLRLSDKIESHAKKQAERLIAIGKIQEVDSWVHLVSEEHKVQLQHKIRTSIERAAKERRSREKASWGHRTNQALKKCFQFHNQTKLYKSRLRMYARSRNSRGANVEANKLKNWLNGRGGEKLRSAMQTLQQVQQEMEEQDMKIEFISTWLKKVRVACRQ